MHYWLEVYIGDTTHKYKFRSELARDHMAEALEEIGHKYKRVIG